MKKKKIKRLKQISAQWHATPEFDLRYTCPLCKKTHDEYDTEQVKKNDDEDDVDGMGEGTFTMVCPNKKKEFKLKITGTTYYY